MGENHILDHIKIYEEPVFIKIDQQDRGGGKPEYLFLCTDVDYILK